MATEITLTATKDYYVLSNVFQFDLKDLLLYYMKNVSLAAFLDDDKEDYVHPATTYFVMCTA